MDTTVASHCGTIRSTMHQPVIGVLRGGPSPEYEVSLKTGHTVLTHLPQARYRTQDIFIDKTGVWHVRGREMEPARALATVDAVFNALHGAYGEDGTVQRLMETHAVPFTGSGTLGSCIAMHKHFTKRHLAQTIPTIPRAPVGRVRFAPHVANRMLRVPSVHLVSSHGFHAEPQVQDPPLFIFPADVFFEEGGTTNMVEEITNKLFPPYVVKPVSGGSSLGMSVVSTSEELVYALMHAFAESQSVLVEQFVHGKEVTVSVVEDFRDEELYAFPPVLIQPKKSTWFDYAEKYEGHATEVCPAPLPPETTRALLDSARYVHCALGLRDYSRSDFIVGNDGIYFLEVNTLPGLTPTSLFPKAVEAVGATLPQMVEHIVLRALARKNVR